jgi:glycosyltransferase involved in cell wall biosynthesis
MPIVSVVIPTHNRACELEQAIDSALSQSLQDLEIIVVDDGSTDETQALSAKYDARVIFLRQEKSGASVARNAGILAARGEFVAFLDSDDTFLPGHLEDSVAFLRSEPGIDFVFGDVEKFNAAGVEMASFFKGKRVERIPFDPRGPDRRVFLRSIFPDLIAGNFIPTPTLVVRRGCFARTGLFNPEFKFLNDTEMYLRMTRLYRGGCFNRVVARVRVGEDNLTHPRWSEIRARTKLRLLHSLSDIDGGLSPDERSEADDQITKTHFGLAYILLQKGRGREARKEALASLRCDPIQPRAFRILALSFFPRAAAFFHR